MLKLAKTPTEYKPIYDQMTSNSRISDIVHLLADPIGYVNEVISSFVSYDYDPETSKVRIGITGKGDAPNYKIEEPSFTSPLAVRSLPFEMTVTPAHTFNGCNYTEMTQLDDHPWHRENWSTDVMTFTELKALLSSLSRSESQH
jgi:hypothetical protein